MLLLSFAILHNAFLPRDALCKRGILIACRLSVRNVGGAGPQVGNLGK